LTACKVISLILHEQNCVIHQYRTFCLIVYQSPSTVSVADDEPVVTPIVAWQVYCPSWDCPSWDWRSGLMVRV